MPRQRLNKREEAFIREYIVDMNGTQAAIKAGYSPRTAGQKANNLLKKVEILTEIQAQIKARFERLDIDADTLLNRAATVLRADPRQLTSHHIGACRYCWGVEHRYHWRTPREFSEAVEQHMLKGEAYQANHPAPDNEGGYGYRKTRGPNPDCPECDGLGVPYTVFADTKHLSDEAAILFEGVKESRHGIEFVMASKKEAFDVLAKRHGLLTQKIEVGGKDGKPIEHEVTAKVIIVPAKVAAPTTTRPMPDEDD